MLDRFASPLMKIAAPLAKNDFEPFATMESASPIDGAVQRKMHGQKVVRAGKGITLVNMDGIIRITKSLENLGVLIDRFVKQ